MRSRAGNMYRVPAKWLVARAGTDWPGGSCPGPGTPGTAAAEFLHSPMCPLKPVFRAGSIGRRRSAMYRYSAALRSVKPLLSPKGKKVPSFRLLAGANSPPRSSSACFFLSSAAAAARASGVSAASAVSRTSEVVRRGRSRPWRMRRHLGGGLQSWNLLETSSAVCRGKLTSFLRVHGGQRWRQMPDSRYFKQLGS